MHRANKQDGLTFLGLLIILAPFTLLGYIAMVAAPTYIEAYSVSDVLNSMKKDYDLREKPREEIYNVIRKRLDVNDIKSVRKEDIEIKKTTNDVSITVDYEARVPLFGNVALAISFHKQALIR